MQARRSISDKYPKERRLPFTTTLPLDVIRDIRAAAGASKRTQSSILEDALHDYLWSRRNQLTTEARV
jgi:hypothetical protein